MKYNLFLDDERNPEAVFNYTKLDIYKNLHWVIVRNYNEFINNIIKNGLPEIVSFDHDLADINYDSKTAKQSFNYQEKTGYDCAKWLVDYCIDKQLNFPVYYIHSKNQVGAENIKQYLLNYERLFRRNNY